MFKDIVDFIKNVYKSEKVPLHAPRFYGNEKKYLNECIDTTYVSYLGEFVDKFENMIKEYTGAGYAIATVNGTLALHTALILAGVQRGDEIIAPALTFIGTINPILYCGAKPIFIDSEPDTLGMSPDKLEEFLSNESEIKNDGYCYNKSSNSKIKVCLPVHVFGHPVKIDKINHICNKYNICLIEDSAESVGSKYKGKHTGTFGKIGFFSFNGNKIVTTGGGGMIVTDDKKIAEKARHITTTAKKQHPYEYIHDEVGYNYRMPNINAAIGCAQMENLEKFLKNKRELSLIYKDFFDKKGIKFFMEPEDCYSNYWLNLIFLKNSEEKYNFLEYSNTNGVSTRPIWRLMNKLDLFVDCQKTDLTNAEYLEERLVNIPSSVF